MTKEATATPRVREITQAPKETRRPTEVTTGIDVTLTEAQRVKLCQMAPEARPSEAMSGLATGLLQDLADGGSMLSANSIARLRHSLPNPFDEQALIGLVEKGARRFGQSEVIEYVVDPIWKEPLNQWAATNGRTAQELVQDCMQQAFDQEWFYNMAFERKTLYLTTAQYATLCAALGREVVSGADVVDYMAAMSEPPELVSK